MVKDKLFPLEQLGYDKRYFLKDDGTILDTIKDKILYPDKYHKFYLKTASNTWHGISLKSIYKKAFNRVYCIDNIEDMKDEVWKQVVLDKQDIDTSNYYVSNKGRIKSYRGYEAIILKEWIYNGYHLVSIGGLNYRVHRLVALAFIHNNDDTKITVDHIDANKDNNTAENLQWLSLVDNVKKGGAK